MVGFSQNVGNRYVDYGPEKGWLNFGNDPEHILNTSQSRL